MIRGCGPQPKATTLDFFFFSLLFFNFFKRSETPARVAAAVSGMTGTGADRRPEMWGERGKFV